MIQEIILAIIQAATEFLPISSSGHLALVSNLISTPDLFLITTLHVASLIAVLIFTRKEIKGLFFEKKYRSLWIYLIIATIPAALFGLFFKNIIEKSFSSFLFIGIAFIFTSVILFLTKFTKTKKYSKFNYKNSLLIGLFQILALFPGISRSGMTISSAMFAGIERQKAVKFSLLLFIPLSIGAFALELGQFYFSISLLAAFIICLFLSLLFLNLLMIIVKKEKFWIFSVYTLILGIVCLGLYFY